MLQELTIKNYALIEEIQISFEKGLNILTGETGAGKSIIIGALSLLLGERVSTDVVRKGSQGCEVSGLFSLEGCDALKSFLAENDIIDKVETELLFKRVLSKAGKGKCYLNGQVVTLTILHRVGTYLVDIHGQHTHQLLFNQSEQMEIIDRYGKLVKYRKKVILLYGDYKKKSEELKLIQISVRDSDALRDLYRYQLKEISGAKLNLREEEELETDCNILSNAEKISLLLQDIRERLYYSDNSIKSNIEKTEKSMEKLAAIDGSFSKRLEKISGFKYDLEDISSALDEYGGKIEFNPKRLEEVIERQELIKKLKRKYGKSIEDILGLEKELRDKLEKLDNSPRAIKSLEKEVNDSKSELLEAAKVLSGKRKIASEKMSEEIVRELKGLAMGRTSFSASINSSEVKSTGIDDVEFMIMPNVGEDMKPLASIASGGETSRIMLGIKTVLANADRVPVLIFDEIDTGIGGGVAGVVGRKLRGLCPDHQVICVTHLPQIAGYANIHYHVDKSVAGSRTRTSIKRLDQKERVNEIARMLGGEKKTHISQKHAIEILEQSAI